MTRTAKKAIKGINDAKKVVSSIEKEMSECRSSEAYTALKKRMMIANEALIASALELASITKAELDVEISLL